MSELQGLRAIVTGSTRGLGEAIARDLAGRGAAVVVNGTDRGRCAQLAEEIDGLAIPGSVADEATAERLVAACNEAWGGVDLLVNNAGLTRDGMLARLTVDEFDEVVGVHLRGSWLLSRAAARAMLATGGSIVNVVSGTALYGNIGQSPYAAAKGGLLALTRSLSLELARKHVRVNAISPVARTRMIDPLLALANGDGRLESYFGDPADIAPLVAYLASPASAGVTGQVLGFDGRQLSVWSHPAMLRRERRAEPWTPSDIAAAIGDDLAELQPDELGAAVLGLLGVEATAKVP